MKDDWTKIENWSAAYDNAGAVPAHPAIIEAWPRDAAAYREENAPEVAAYGSAERERIYLFRPESPPKGLVVFIHGGWWRRFEPESFLHLARGPVARGWAVAMPGYTLCPNIKVTGICAQMESAVSVACEQVGDGPLVICGHSAGGHLTAYLGSGASDLSEAAASRLARIVPISGIADLRPLLRTDVNNDLHLDAAEAEAISPALMSPREGIDCFAWVGGDELPEFRRQNALLASTWGAHIDMHRIEADGLNHYDVIAPLSDADSDLTRVVTMG